MSDLYADRRVYRAMENAGDLQYFRVTAGQTDLEIGALRPLRPQALGAMLDARRQVEAELTQRPEFGSALEPLRPRGDETPVPAAMLRAGRVAGTGPMAAVAGAIARAVGLALLPLSPELTVENGGDVFLAGSRPRVIAIWAGDSPISGKLGLRLTPGTGLGVATSSGTCGHSLSFGRADAAVAVAPDAALADAVATMLGNRCKTAQDLPAAVEWAAALPGVRGAVAVLGDRVAAAGRLELTRL